MGFEIDFLAVGEGERSGDAIALRFGNLQGSRDNQIVVVIDGGYQTTGQEMVDHIIKYYQTHYVDVAVSTHPDADHSAGLMTVMENLKVGSLWMHRPWLHTEDIARMFRDDRVTDASVRAALRRSLDSARDLEKLAVRLGVPIVEPFAGLSDKSGRILVAGPTEKFYESQLPGFRGTPEPISSLGFGKQAISTGKEIIRRIVERWDIETLTDDGETSAENNTSVILLIQADIDKYLLLTGDAGIPSLTGAADLLSSRGFDLKKLNFIQIPHHGSQRNVGPTILNRILGPKLGSETKAKTAFVSVAKDGSPKHPSKKVMNAFKRRGVLVYATQGQGKRHSHDAPERSSWQPAVELPFFNEVED